MLEKWQGVTEKNRKIYEKYLNSCRSNNEETWDTTYKTYVSRMYKFLKWLNKEKNRYLLSQDTLENAVEIIEEYKNYCRECGNSKRTIANAIVTISSFYDWTVRRKMIKYHPFKDRLEKQKITDRDSTRDSYYLTTEQILTARLYMKVEHKKFDLQDRILWELFIDSACRISAIQALTLEQLELEGGYFKNVIEKEGYVVNAYFFDTCKALIKEWLQERERAGIEEKFLFVTKYQKEYKQMSQATIRNRIRKIGKILEIEGLYPHSLRKTSINLLSKLGGLDIASHYANHTSTVVTSKHYIEKESATEIRNQILALRQKIGIF
ncbi:tyrosine-type recombinase/integrase [Fusobacterium necrophorum]|uniref:tyrosine-type recombinase/integrase n=1 Tax=Fusobacterium necrophorum TaxID=859 RepID=UPI002549D23A|nr:tyrosine-type recombinase/integrase [Fusobacterium necrophorum]MDK4510335.1 tyrosine-type recombinase/integrase [Fusobacterium necrophorum]